jgi:hypothetical protein
MATVTYCPELDVTPTARDFGSYGGHSRAQYAIVLHGKRDADGSTFDVLVFDIDGSMTPAGTLYAETDAEGRTSCLTFTMRDGLPEDIAEAFENNDLSERYAMPARRWAALVEDDFDRVRIAA